MSSQTKTTERGLKNINVFYSTFINVFFVTFFTFFNVFNFFLERFFYIYGAQAAWLRAASLVNASNSAESFYYMEGTSFHLLNPISFPKFRG